jgi:hypothetical protein
MCKQCDRLKVTINSGEDIDGLNRDILNLYDRAQEMLEANTGGSLRDDVDLASSNLARMYEIAAPLCLVRKAHAIHQLRLRKLGPSRREPNSPVERRARFIAIRGDKTDE